MKGIVTLLAGILLGLPLGAWTLRQNGSTAAVVVRTNRLELVDSQDRIRGVFDCDESGGVGLSLRTADGTPSVAMKSTADGLATMWLGASDSELFVQLQAGPGHQGDLWIMDPERHNRTVLSVSDSQGPTMSVFNDFLGGVEIRGRSLILPQCVTLVEENELQQQDDKCMLEGGPAMSIVDSSYTPLIEIGLWTMSPEIRVNGRNIVDH